MRSIKITFLLIAISGLSATGPNTDDPSHRSGATLTRPSEDMRNAISLSIYSNPVIYEFLGELDGKGDDDLIQKMYDIMHKYYFGSGLYRKIDKNAISSLYSELRTNPLTKDRGINDAKSREIFNELKTIWTKISDSNIARQDMPGDSYEYSSLSSAAGSTAPLQITSEEMGLILDRASDFVMHKIPMIHDELGKLDTALRACEVQNPSQDQLDALVKAYENFKAQLTRMLLAAKPLISTLQGSRSFMGLLYSIIGQNQDLRNPILDYDQVTEFITRELLNNPPNFFANMTFLIEHILQNQNAIDHLVQDPQVDDFVKAQIISLKEVLLQHLNEIRLMIFSLNQQDIGRNLLLAQQQRAPLAPSYANATLSPESNEFGMRSASTSSTAMPKRVAAPVPATTPKQAADLSGEEINRLFNIIKENTDEIESNLNDMINYNYYASQAGSRTIFRNEKAQGARQTYQYLRSTLYLKLNKLEKEGLKNMQLNGSSYTLSGKMMDQSFKDLAPLFDVMHKVVIHNTQEGDPLRDTWKTIIDHVHSLKPDLDALINPANTSAQTRSSSIWQVRINRNN
jgi:hypothetical protein